MIEYIGWLIIIIGAGLYIKNNIFQSNELIDFKSIILIIIGIVITMFGVYLS